MSARRIIHWLIRVPLGVVIAVAGISKLVDVPGFVAVIHTYRFSIPGPAAVGIAILVSVFELGLGLWMLSGYAMRTAAKLSMLMHAGYASLLTITLLRGIHLQNCGCFGAFHARPLQWYTPLEDVALIGVSYALLTLTYEHDLHHGSK